MGRGHRVARLRDQRAESEWPGELARFDPRRWSSRAAWHLARAHAAPSKFVALQEIRASVRTPGGARDDHDRGGVVIVEPGGELAHRGRSE